MSNKNSFDPEQDEPYIPNHIDDLKDLNRYCSYVNIYQNSF